MRNRITMKIFAVLSLASAAPGDGCYWQSRVRETTAMLIVQLVMVLRLPLSVVQLIVTCSLETETTASG